MAPLPMISSATSSPHNSDKQKNNTNNNRCDVCRIVQVLRDGNLTMQFMGDSITHQMTYGWICELQNRNFQVTTTMHLNDQTSFDVHITSPRWDSPGNVVTVAFYNAMTFRKNLHTWDDLQNVDILVLNYGAHWAINATRTAKQTDYSRDSLNQTFQYWLTIQDRLPRLLAFRETSLQHFDTDSGEYYLPSLHTHSNGTHTNTTTPNMCAATSQRTYVGWREAIVNTIATYHGFRVLTADESLTQQPPRTSHSADSDPTLELIWLPFLNFTAELHFMHTSDRSSNDCTHFCQSPYLWWPVWRSLRLAVDRAFPNY
jgi:hypothetical protein